MYVFPNYFVINYKFTNFSILKYRDIYYISICSNDEQKFTIIPLGYYFSFLSYGICIFFKNDISLYKNYLYYFKFMLYSCRYYIINKIKFRYKGSCIHMRKKRLNGVVLEFGRCHRVYLVSLGLFFYRKKRLLAAHLFSIYGININEIVSFAQTVRAVRPFSMYTLRGIRFSRQRFYKRVGKVSKYTMFKSKIF